MATVNEMVNDVLSMVNGLSSNEVIEVIETVLVSKLATVNDEGSVVDFDMDSLKKVIADLTATKKEYGEICKENEKAKRAVETEEKRSAGKAFSIANIHEGDYVVYATGTGKQIKFQIGLVAKQKDGAKRLHIICDKSLDTGTGKLDRYVDFSRIVAMSVEDFIAKYPSKVPSYWNKEEVA